MMMPATPREPLPKAGRIATLRAQNEAQSERIKQLEIENKLLREKVDLLVRRIFGKSSEALDEKQLMLLLQGDDAAKKGQASEGGVCALEAEIARNDKATHSDQKKRKDREARVPEHLPISEQIVIEPEEVKAAPEAWRHVNDEVTEQLDYTPGRYTRRLIILLKYAKRDESHQAPVIAELPALMERCKAAPGLLAHIIVSKYCDHLPLSRTPGAAAESIGRSRSPACATASTSRVNAWRAGWPGPRAASCPSTRASTLASSPEAMRSATL